MRCPTCAEWGERVKWADAPGQSFPFRLLCPWCGAEHDCAEPEFRIRLPEAARVERLLVRIAAWWLPAPGLLG